MITSVEEVRKLIGKSRIVTTSGGYDCLHVGHVRCILEMQKILSSTILDRVYHVVIVNSDEFLKRKKGYAFMPLSERMEIINAIRGVDFVVPWEDGTQFVSGALEILCPDVFAKGGDRSTPESVPEYNVCEKIGCRIVFGVGGVEKVQSSSSLIANGKNNELVK